MVLNFSLINAKRNNLQEVKDLLRYYDLELDADVTHVLEARDEESSLVGCGGIAGNTLKCIAISDAARGEGVALSLLSELLKEAWEMGCKDPFLFTKPENEKLFAECGFTPLAAMPGKAVLMEKNKARLSAYLASLAPLKKPGKRIGSLVMNCNPFTLGHRFLVEESLKRCDWVHLFLVKEDRSFFSYEDRLALVRSGVEDLPRLTVHEGSEYILSQATFPRYFLKEEKDVCKAHAGIDLQLFRKHIAPTLGITDRFVGEEPFCAVTSSYNDDMAYWLTTDEVNAPPVALTIIPRASVGGEPVSASRVRKLWRENGAEAAKDLVPQSTYEFFKKSEFLRK